LWQPSIPMTSPWQKRFRLGLTPASPDPLCETAMPTDVVRLDFFWPLLLRPVCFGPLNPLLAGRTVGVEHFRVPPRAPAVRVARLKALALGTVASRQRERRGAALLQPPYARRPTLVAVCCEGPGAWSRERATPHALWQGVWTVHDRHADIWVLDVPRLANDGTWGALRFAAAPGNVSLQALIAELLGDPWIPTLDRDQLIEDVMHNPREWNEPPAAPAKETIVQTLLRQGREEGREEGRAEGALLGKVAADATALDRLLPLLDPVWHAPLRAAVGTDRFAEKLAEAVAARAAPTP
jgi:hypothetical protein